MDTDAVRQNLLSAVRFLVKEAQIKAGGGNTPYDNMDLDRMNKIELTNLRASLCDLLFDPDEGEM